MKVKINQTRIVSYEMYNSNTDPPTHVFSVSMDFSSQCKINFLKPWLKSLVLKLVTVKAVENVFSLVQEQHPEGAHHRCQEEVRLILRVCGNVKVIEHGEARHTQTGGTGEIASEIFSKLMFCFPVGISE